MTDTTNLSIRMNRDLKNEADQLFFDMGMTLTTAITIFVKQAIRQKKIPFEIALDTNHNRYISLADAQAAAERIWDNAERNGTADMSIDEINDVIKAARAERKARKINI